MKKKMFLLLCLFMAMSPLLFAAVAGDADGNGTVTIIDALLVAQYSVRAVESFPGINACDVNGDSLLNIVDALLIAHYSVGLIREFPGAGFPSGILVGVSACKSNGLAADAAVASYVEKVSLSDECVSYQYSPEEEILTLRYLNGGFNCCGEPELLDMQVGAGYIDIEIGEGNGAFCNCLCLMDMEFRILNVSMMKYQVYINSLYISPDDPPAMFILDLAASSGGTVCIYRGTYPWQP